MLVDHAKLQLGGKPWKARRVNWLKHNHGTCNYKKKEIVVCQSANKVRRGREITLHEMLHAIWPHLDEEEVKVAAWELDVGLSACGY